MSNAQHTDDVLAGNWIADGTEELVTLTDDMFIRRDDTPETEARTLAGLAAMEQADKLYKERLADLRRATGLTQTEVAHHMGVSQSGVAAIETPTDIRISTLVRYLEAIGGRGELVVEFPDHTRLNINLEQLVPNRQ
jgi:DNA-binding XRE family transcriptional regulator